MTLPDFSRVRVTRSRSIDLTEIARAAVDVVRKHPDCPSSARLMKPFNESAIANYT